MLHNYEFSFKWCQHENSRVWNKSVLDKHWLTKFESFKCVKLMSDLVDKVNSVSKLQIFDSLLIEFLPWASKKFKFEHL